MDKMYDVVISNLKLILEWSPRLVAAIAVLVISWWVIKKLEVFVRGKLDNSNIDPTIKPFTMSIISVGLKLVLLAIVAAVLGIETTSFVAVFGALVFAIGMALQGSLGHIASGVLLLIFKPYKVGDFITIGENAGFVKEIQIINTVIESLDNEMIIIPNGMAIGEVIVNSTGEDNLMRFNVDFYMPYEERFDKVKKIVDSVLEECQYVSKEKEALIGIGAFESHNVKVEIKPYCTIQNYEKAMVEVAEKVKSAMGKNDVKAAYSEGVELGPIGV